MVPPTTGDPGSRVISRDLVNSVCQVLEPLCIPNETTAVPSVEKTPRIAESTGALSVGMTSNSATQAESQTALPSPSSDPATHSTLSSPSASSESSAMSTEAGSAGDAPSVAPSNLSTTTTSSGLSKSAGITGTSSFIGGPGISSHTSSAEIASKTPPVSGIMAQSFTNKRSLVAAVIAVSIVSLVCIITILLIWKRRLRLRKQHRLNDQNMLEELTTPSPFMMTPSLNSTSPTLVPSKRVSFMNTISNSRLRPLPPTPDDVSELCRNGSPESTTSPAAVITSLHPISSRYSARYLLPIGVLPDTEHSSWQVSAVRGSGITEEMPEIVTEYVARSVYVNATPLLQHAQETDGGIRLDGGRPGELSGDAAALNESQGTLPPPYAEY
ncbi:hypothetical protein C8Q79DRAFT_334997 [Trametes meyenii]|nr:hypothetical protein C8Q79DRAFT_334997 [Trametes meyenii]